MPGCCSSLGMIVALLAERLASIYDEVEMNRSFPDRLSAREEVWTLVEDCAVSVTAESQLDEVVL